MSHNESEDPSQEDRDFVAPGTGEENIDKSSESDISESTEMSEEPAEASTLSFSETEEMAMLRQEMIEAGQKTPEKFQELAIQWKHLADNEASQLSGEQYDRAMIEIMMTQADIWLSIGNESDYYDDLEQALDYANNMGFEDLATRIRTKLGS